LIIVFSFLKKQFGAATQHREDTLNIKTCETYTGDTFEVNNF
jgi:hypothetical protein